MKLKKNSARQAVSAEERLVICLRYLATGASFRHLSFDFFMSECTVRRIIHETCAVLASELKPNYLKTPTTAVEWIEIANGAIDGKHVKLRAHANSGSVYFNYKKGFSTVMMAVSDAQHRIVYVSVGSFGRESDGGIFDRSDFAKALRDVANPLDLPAHIDLPGTTVAMPDATRRILSATLPSA